ncbi:MAG: replicative DNA helicase [Chloroflexota bacterium]|nr:MAG: replicative DNA helicase [Chloroflexota bacterium]
MTQVERGAPPSDERAEAALLGALLVDPDAVSRISTILRSGDFARARNGRVYEAIVTIYSRRDTVDFVSVAAELDRSGQFDMLGGPAYLTSLINQAPTSLHAETYARQVERTALMRRLIVAGEQIRDIGYDNPADIKDALDRAQRLLFGLDERQGSGEVISLRSALDDFFEKLDRRHESRGAMFGVPTGFADLDKVTGGLHESDLIILAARPSVGKSALAFNIARNAAVNGNSVLVFSLEMSIDLIAQRLLCGEAGIDSQRLGAGYLDEGEWRRISEAFGVLSEAPIWFDDTAGITTMDLRMKARRLKMEHDIKLIVIDYIQLMRGRGLENRVQEVSEISRSLKELARELNVPVIALSQLSRAIEARQDHRPVLSDLRESGSIEQDADIVMFIHREELYNPATDRKNLADLIIAKHRNGPTATVQLRFFPSQTRFADLEIYRPDPDQLPGRVPRGELPNRTDD